MDVKEINLNQNEVEQLSGIDETIRQKSTTQVSLQIQSDNLKSQVKDLYEFRKQFLDKKLTDEGLDVSRIVNAAVMPDGGLAKIVVSLRPVTSSER